MGYLFSILLGYVLGSSSMAYYIGKLKRQDVRKAGTGNLGASNTAVLFGWGAAVLVAVHDIAKAAIAVLAAKLLFGDLAYAGAAAGAAAVIGHIFPLWMGFSGGKGLACIGGLVLAYNWRLFLLMLAAEILLVLIFQYICIMPISVSIVFPIVYGMQTGDSAGTLALVALIPVIVYKHLPNLRRILTGQEARISWLWNAEKEEARLKERFTDQEWKRIYRKASQK